jgi:hypothetical protein
MLVRDVFLTCKFVAPTTEPKVALITVAPPARPLTTPSLPIVARLGWLLLQAAAFVRSKAVPSE